MTWVKDIFDPKSRRWEEFYRNRWQYDKVVRSTHGVNCTGGCSWGVYVKDGIVTWEMQETDYPIIDPKSPPYEPRGCPRGISFSWYLYSPLRIKYPYIRGALLDLWRKARGSTVEPVEAWASIVEDEKSRSRYQQARGKGGLRRASWDEALEIIAASTVYTIKEHGPDRIIGFSPIPAMSMLSYAAGSRFLQLLGGVSMSFYDWYSDLPPASPETWGEQTDVCESADWYNSAFTVAVGSNINMTRTPDAHFIAEARHNGSKFVAMTPDFSQVAKYADWWIPVAAGQDGAFWMAVDHVILNEFHVKKSTPYFVDYLKRFTDSPFLVVLQNVGGNHRPGKMLRANLINRYKEVENGDWKLLVLDAKTKSPKMPKGSLGFRWQETKGQWNLEMKDGLDDKVIEPMLSLLGEQDEFLQVEVEDFSAGRTLTRGVPVKYIKEEDGTKVPVTTVYDLLMAQFGVPRGIAGNYPKGYDDDSVPFTPAWQEKITGIDASTVIEFARQWAETAERTEGRCMIIIGGGVNQWFQNDLVYRACIASLMLCGCVGRNGGGLGHYVGQEKLAPVAPWSAVAFAGDWAKPPRLQNTPSFHYVHSDQWRYEGSYSRYYPLPKTGIPPQHAIDVQAKAVRMGWLPFFPQFNRSPISILQEAGRAGAKDDQEKLKWVVGQLKAGKLRFAVEDPDAPENWPRLWFIWRANALMSSAKGHEYFLKHYLGTHTATVADEVAKGSTSEVVWRDESPRGKLDLVVDINFRMDTSALYSDIVLPTATWYEKDDLNTTDLHSFIHPLTAAIPPCWESKSDWEIFKSIAKKVSELAATHLPKPVKEVVTLALQHDTPDEMAQPTVKDWKKGECDPVPGKTMPKLIIVERDYVNLYNRFVSFGPLVKRDGLSAHGVHWDMGDMYDELAESRPISWPDGQKFPSLNEPVEAANIILHLAPETNGEVAYRAFKAEEEKIGLPLSDLAQDYRATRCTFDDIVEQPKRILTSPVWSGIVNGGRAYAPFAINVERLVPWRTLTGRQQLYLDHELFTGFGEGLPTFKPRPDVASLGELSKSETKGGKEMVLNYLTPHGKWHIHSTYSDNLRMLTLSRGVEPLWLNDKDAESMGVKDNDWVEAFNDNGVTVTRACVSARIPKGACLLYHSPERTISVPKAPSRGYRRAGGHNSPTRLRLKPLLMAGGYAQFTYSFNYWGPTGGSRDTYVVVRKLGEEPRW
ncbi:MAG TPA: nitrate reductase subunit alpha [Conexivisphaerales archaeon]|nr:nitrate reductase subunit alpha [Conexivisphaerales archaeon]